MENTLKIISWNINGLRASKSHFQNLIQSQSCDIVCFQETKLTRDQLDEETALIEGYNSYYSFSRRRSGYSGVATICKDSCTPVGAEEGLSSTLQAKLNNKDGVGHYGDYQDFTSEELNALDSEGRALITLHKIKLSDETENLLALINVYCPRADCENEDRKRFKIKFYELLQLRANALRQSGCHVIIVGDINTSHKIIDTCWPVAAEDFPVTDGREWLDQFLSKPVITLTDDGDIEDSKAGNYFVDTFRYFYPDQKEAYTCWCTKTGARTTNYGTRLDYIFADNALVESAFVDSTLLPQVEGSDHCPIMGELRCQAIPATKPPLLCTKFYPEFSGKQQKLVSFFTKQSSQSATRPEAEPPPKRLCTETTVKTKKGAKLASQKKLTSFFGPPKEKVKNNSCVDSQPLLEQRNGSQKVDSSQETSDEAYSSQTDKLELSRDTLPNADTDPVKITKSANASLLWKSVFQAPKAPKCKGHDEECLLRTVKKAGPNCGRQFYVCPRPEGLASNPDARCDFFMWKKKS